MVLGLREASMLEQDKKKRLAWARREVTSREKSECKVQDLKEGCQYQAKREEVTVVGAE